MNITHVTIKLHATHNMGDYSNVKPEVTLTAELTQADDAETVLADLADLARAQLHAEIDRHLQLLGESPVFFSGDRYDVLVNKKEKLLVVVRHSPTREYPNGWDTAGYSVAVEAYGFEHDATYDVENRYQDFTRLDCTGNAYDLPHLFDYPVYYHSAAKLLVMTDAVVCQTDLPGQDWYKLRTFSARLQSSIPALIASLGKEKPWYTVINATGGNLAAIPALPVAEPPAPEPEEDEDDEDDALEFEEDEDDQ